MIDNTQNLSLTLNYQVHQTWNHFGTKEFYKQLHKFHNSEPKDFAQNPTSKDIYDIISKVLLFKAENELVDSLKSIRKREKNSITSEEYFEVLCIVAKNFNVHVFEIFHSRQIIGERMNSLRTFIYILYKVYGL